jgi:serine/threonine-protein kinase
VSADGRWLAYDSNSSGQFEIYVRPFPNVGAGQWQISTAGGTRPLWARSGRELFYVAADGTLAGVGVDARGTTWSAGPPAKILEARYDTGGSNVGRNYDVSPDGQRFLMIKGASDQTAAPPQIVVVRNWTEELKRLVPTN